MDVWGKEPCPTLELLEARRRRGQRRSDGADRLETQAPDDDARCDKRGGLEHELRAKSGSAGGDQAPPPPPKKDPSEGGTGATLSAPASAFPPLAQVAAGAEDAGFDRRHADAEHFGDLRVAAILDLAHHDRARAGSKGSFASATQEHIERRPLVVGASRLACALERDLVAAGGPTGASASCKRCGAILISQLCGLLGPLARWNAR